MSADIFHADTEDGRTEVYVEREILADGRVRYEISLIEDDGLSRAVPVPTRMLIVTEEELRLIVAGAIGVIR